MRLTKYKPRRSPNLPILEAHLPELRQRLLDGETYVELSHLFKMPVLSVRKWTQYLFRDELPELLETGKQRRIARVRAEIRADYAAGMSYEYIQAKYHAERRIVSIVHALGLKRSPYSTPLSVVYTDFVGRVLGEGSDYGQLEVLSLTPKHFRVHCLECGKTFLVPRSRVVNGTAVCTCQASEAGLDHSRPAIVRESSATVWCMAPQSCPIAEICHLCCRECARRDRCHYIKCVKDPATCDRAKRRKR